MKANGIRHITSAAYKPSTNGLTERMVQTFKESLATSTDSLGVFLDKFLFKYRITPHTTTGVSPSELMFRRKCRNRLDRLFPSDQLDFRVAQRQESQRLSRKSGRSLQLHPGDPVVVRNYASGSKWVPGTVQEKTGPVSFCCALPDGQEIRRHQDQVLPCKVPP